MGFAEPLPIWLGQYSGQHFTPPPAMTAHPASDPILICVTTTPAPKGKVTGM